MDYIMGVDIGTSGCKALAWSLQGKVSAQAQQGYETRHPRSGYSEQDPDAVLQAVMKVIRAVRQKVKHSPRCISFSAAMHSLMAVDGEGDPLTPLLLWSDSRAVEQAEALRRRAGGKNIYRHTGTPIHAMSPLCKLIWWKAHEPRLFKKAARFISIKEYILYRFTGQYVVDYGIASATGLFDHEKLRWYPPALKAAGIAADRLSKPVSGLHVLSAWRKSYASKLGLPADTPLVTGGSDGCLANLGSGAVVPGRLVITIGTSAAVRMTAGKPSADARQRLFCYLLDGKTYVTGGAMNNGGVLLDWFTRQFEGEAAERATYADFVKTACAAPAGSEGLLFLPYLLGERSPMWDGRARGAFVGIGIRHTRAHFMRAVLEGICYTVYEVGRIVEEQAAPAKRIYVSGGFTHSPQWVQLLADVMGKPVYVGGHADASTMGAAMMGGVAMGIWKGWKEAAALLPAGKSYRPRAVQHRIHKQHFEMFTSLYAPLKETFHRIAAIQEGTPPQTLK
ncbi:gluconokinase [Compostibacter hankyongensis]|uniref:Gluconokinase n=1 Tax=Compostibacter hankyongensis TaxID=1007089 RepID=A0ABP8FZW6_9BACT